MKLAGWVAIAILVLWGAAALLQLWFGWFSLAFFVKFTISCALVGVIVPLVALIRREYGDERRQKKDKYID